MWNIRWTLMIAIVIAAGSPSWAGDVVRISTAVGRGADTWITPDGGEDAGATTQLMLRHSDMAGDTAKVYLRFDLAAIRNDRPVDAKLVVDLVELLEQPVDVEVFGLGEANVYGEGLLGEAWSEERPEGVQQGDVLQWSSAPGHAPESKGGYWTSEDAVSAGMGSAWAEHLGTWRLEAGTGLRQTFSSPQLVEFVRSDANGVVTVILTRATKMTRPTRLASKEHPILGAPKIEVAVEALDVAERAQRLWQDPIEVDGAKSTIERQWLEIQLLARQSADDALTRADQLVDVLAHQEPIGEGDALPDSRQARAEALGMLGSLGRLLRAQVARSAHQIDYEQWLVTHQEVMAKHAQGSDVLMAAALGLIGDGWSEQNLSRLLDAGLPNGAQNVLVGWYHISRAPPPDADAAAHLQHVLRVAAWTDTASPDAALLDGYVRALKRRIGEAGAIAALDQLWALAPESTVGVAAGLSRLQLEPDPEQRFDLLGAMDEMHPGSMLANHVRPLRVSLLAASQDPRPILTELAKAGLKQGASLDAQPAADIYMQLTEGMTKSSTGTDGSGSSSSASSSSRLSVATSLAEKLLAQDACELAAQLALAALEAEGLASSTVTQLRQLLAQDLPSADMQAAARVALAQCYEQLGRIKDALVVVQPATSLAVGEPVERQVVWQTCRLCLLAGDVEGAEACLRAHGELTDDVPAFAQLHDTIQEASPAAPRRAALLASLNDAREAARGINDSDSAKAVYFKAIDCCIALGYTHEAIAVCEEAAERFTGEPLAVEAMERGIALLEGSGETDHRTKAEALRRRLRDQQEGRE